jgi:hypothetical protein
MLVSNEHFAISSEIRVSRGPASRLRSNIAMLQQLVCRAWYGAVSWFPSGRFIKERATPEIRDIQ